MCGLHTEGREHEKGSQWDIIEDIIKGNQESSLHNIHCWLIKDHGVSTCYTSILHILALLQMSKSIIGWKTFIHNLVKSSIFNSIYLLEF